jgi:hypothetical protein
VICRVALSGIFIFLYESSDPSHAGLKKNLINKTGIHRGSTAVTCPVNEANAIRKLNYSFFTIEVLLRSGKIINDYMLSYYYFIE